MAKLMDARDLSPFRRHRKLLLDHYGAARILRNATISMWCGTGFGLSKIGWLDEDHLPIFFELLNHYSVYGENDDDFMAVALECKEIEDRIAEQN
jgi:hypothetical protein